MFIIYLPHQDTGSGGGGGNVVLCQNYYDNYSKIYLADSLVNASASDAIVVTPNGNTSISSSVSKFPGGSSMYFDGVGDNISIPPVNDLRPQIFEWTVEMYVYPTSSTGTQTLFVQRNSSGTNSPIWIRLSGLTLQASVYSSFAITITNAGTLILNDWNHIVVQRSAIRSTLEVFLNGTLSGTTTLGNLTVLRVLLNDYWYIGGDSNINYFQGYIQGLLYSVGIAKYSGNFVPPTTQDNGSQCVLTTQDVPPSYVTYPGYITIAGSAELSNVVTGGYVIPDSYSYLQIPAGNLANAWTFSCYYVPDGVESDYSTLFETQTTSASTPTKTSSLSIWADPYVPGPYSPKTQLRFDIYGGSTSSGTITLPEPLLQYSLNLIEFSYIPNPNFWQGNAIPHANSTVSITVNGSQVYYANNFVAFGGNVVTGYGNGMVIHSYYDCTSDMRIGRDFTPTTPVNLATRGIRGYVGPFNLISAP